MHFTPGADPKAPWIIEVLSTDFWLVGVDVVDEVEAYDAATADAAIAASDCNVNKCKPNIEYNNMVGADDVVIIIVDLDETLGGVTKPDGAEAACVGTIWTAVWPTAGANLGSALKALQPKSSCAVSIIYL